MSEKDNEKYTIDNAKNDIQNLQSQNLYDFQEIKRLDGLIKDYDKRILQAINFNNLINKKIQSQISLILDRIKYLEDNPPSTPTVKTYSVTYNLNNVISSNNTTTITENSNYSTSLTPYDSYSISNVTVTVGGVNVTSNVYSNGVINIDNVSGNIEITATGVNQTTI